MGNKFEHISLLQVQAVQRIDSGKTHKKFKVIVDEGHNGKQREILWKCESLLDRNRWVDDLQHRVSHAKNVIGFLSAS